MLRNVLLKTLRDQRRALMGWSLGIVGVTLMYAAFYPSIRDNADTLNEYIQNLPEAFRGFIGESADFASPVGYVQTEMFSIFLPLFFLVYAIGTGARATAGEEEAHTMDLLLSMPIRRSSVVRQKLGAMIAGSALLAVVLWASIALLGPPWGMDIPLGPLAAACSQLLLMGLAFGTIALAVGASSGSRALAIGVASAVAAVTYIVNALAPSVDALDRVRWLSPFYHAIGTDPLREGLNIGSALVLLAVGTVASAYALWAFERRDLSA
jgi:ABC-2 type transport system permease protein